MLTGWQSVPRARGIALVAGALAALAMVVVGCTSVTDGAGAAAEGEAAPYRASVSASLEESAASSSARESERQESMIAEAIQISCEAMSSSSADAIGAVNAYVADFNVNPADVGRTAGPAVDALNISADLVAGTFSDRLDPGLWDALSGWVAAARTVATAIAGNYGTEEFNSAITGLNDSKTAALDRCDEAYR